MIKNITSNILGTVLPSLAALFAVPKIIQILGLNGFGIFSLQVATLFFFGLTDLGISRAIVLLSFDKQFCGDHGWIRPYRIGVRYTSFLCLGLCLIAPLAFLMNYIHPHNVDTGDLVDSTIIIIFSSALMLFSLPQRAIFEATERFLLLNIIRGPTAAAIFLAPLVAFQFESTLTAAAISIAITRIISTIVYFVVSGAYQVHKKNLGSFDSLKCAEMKRLRKTFLRRASWLGITNLLSLAISYMDRFILTVMRSTLAVGQFVIAQEVVTKLWIASGAIISAGTPRLANIKNDPDVRLMHKTSRHLILLMFFTGVMPAIFLIVFGENFLKIWLGNSFAKESVLPLQVMAAGIALNNLSQVNFTLLQIFEGEFNGALLQVFNVVFAASALSGFIYLYGINGAAYAFSLRLFVDALIGRKLLTSNSKECQYIGVGYSLLIMSAIAFAIILYMTHKFF